MTTDIKKRAENAIYGALVADAAAMGTHWIYDQDRVRNIAPNNPEFLPPSSDYYDGVMGYFAHENRTVGEQSQYGEQALVMLRSMVATQGTFDVNHYAQEFRTHFGYGGAYVGYIDHATRQTLDNFTHGEKEALEHAKRIPFDGDESVVTALVIKALAIQKQYTGDAAKVKFIEAVRITHDDVKVVNHGLKILEHIQSMELVTGANDEQFPAISKLPALVALAKATNNANSSRDNVQTAIKVTNTHPRALSYGTVCGALLSAALDGKNVSDIVSAGLSAADEDVSAAIESSLSMTDKSVNEVTAHFGLACDLRYGVPSILHNLKTSNNYAEAIRNNIYAGGDTCGRSILLGALAGAIHGVDDEDGIPQDWINKLAVKDQVNVLLSAVL